MKPPLYLLILPVLLYANNDIVHCAKINTPRVLLPWMENLNVNFTFEIIEGGCYSWSLSRDDIIDLEPIHDDVWSHCSRSARVSVAKNCVPPGSVIIFAEEVNTGEILRGDVDIDKISMLKVTSTTWKLYLEEAPEAFKVVAYDDQGNKFSTLDGIPFSWTARNLEDYGDEPLVTLVKWRDTDYEAPHGVAELESKGLRSHIALLYGQAMGESRVNVCLKDICTDFKLTVVASVVLTPAMAMIAPGDNIKYRVVRARAGRLTVQDISETLYYLTVTDKDTAYLEDSISLVRGTNLGTTSISLMSGVTEVASATLTITEPDSIRVTIRPSNLIIKGEPFNIHCVVFSKGHPLNSGSEILIRLTTEGEADLEMLKSTENGTITEAIATKSGPFMVSARLHSVAGKTLLRKVEGQISAVAVDPLEVVPPELYVAWTDTVQEFPLQYRGGGDEPVSWSLTDGLSQSYISLTSTAVVTVRGNVDSEVLLQLQHHPRVKALGRIRSSPPEFVQVSSTGRARVGRPHQLHIALTATDPNTGMLYNFHRCDCASFALSSLEGPEPMNVTAAIWITPIEGACCVIQCAWESRGVATIRVSRGRLGETHRVIVNSAPKVIWPSDVAMLPRASVPVIAEGEALYPQSVEPRIADIANRNGPVPYNYPDAKLFTAKCHRKGDTQVSLISQTEDESESVSIDTWCAPHVSRIRLEPHNCSAPTKLWLRANQEVSLKVALLDAIGREILDERGHPVTWEIEPNHMGIEIKSKEGLMVETYPEFDPVPVPHKYYQTFTATEQAIGWVGTIKAIIPDATATIQAKVVAPMKVEPLKLNLAWEGESIPNISTISGGSGRYIIESGKGVISHINDNVISTVVPGPGTYDLVVSDSCVPSEVHNVELHIEEILSVEVSTSRAVCVNSCVPIAALVRGISHSHLTITRDPQWRVTGDLDIKDNKLCGLREGSGRVKASLANVWSPEVEVIVFPPLRIIPSKATVPPGARLQLKHAGGPPSHLATLHYNAKSNLVQVSPSGSVLGVTKGTAKVRLIATDITGTEMASAEADIEVIPISGLRVTPATQTLLVGSPCPLSIEGSGVKASSLSALQPTPKATWTVRDGSSARLYGSYADDMLERSVAEGLSIRVVPLKPGVITIDVRVRNLAQAESRTWDSTIEILAIQDIKTSVEGLSTDINSGERLSLAVGANFKLKSMPKSVWKSYEDGSFKVTSDGEVKAIKPGTGVIIATHSDDLNRVYRETAIHIEVSEAHYCTAEPSGSEDSAIILTLRSNIGRKLLAPQADVQVLSHVANIQRVHADYALGKELILTGLEESGSFISFQASMAGTIVTDEVWVTGTDSKSQRIIVSGGWSSCINGVGWSAPSAVSLYPGGGVTLALFNQPQPRTFTLKLDRTQQTQIVTQAAVSKMEFTPGEHPYSKVPLTIESTGLNSGPILCTEEQKYAVEGVEVQLPFVCRTKQPHSAEPFIDIINGMIGCTIIPASPIFEASDIELCAEWDVYRTCTKVSLLPPISISQSKVSLLNPPTMFTITGHPRALKLVKTIPSPGLKLDTRTKDGDLVVTVKSETSSCGAGWVTIKSKLTGQELRVEVEKECDVACGTLLGALLALLRPYLSTLVTIIAVAAAYFYVQSKLQNKALYGPDTSRTSTSIRDTSLWRLE